MNDIENIRLKVGVDLDDTVYNFISPLLMKYNVTYNDRLTLSDITDYKISKFLKPECKNIFKEFADKDFFKNITLEPHVIKELTNLNKKYDLYFCTAGAPITIRDRDKMLSRNLDWYTSSQLVVCRDKGMLKLDYLVDDCLDNVEKGSYTGIIYTKPWNLYSDYPNVFRVNGFNEICDKIEWLEEKQKEWRD